MKGYMMKDKYKPEIEKPSLGDYTRKSVVGAFYRVGASFTMDACYLSVVATAAYYSTDNMNSLDSIANGFSDFMHTLEFNKLLRVTGFVIGINFIDYKFEVTNRLDRISKRIKNKLTDLIKKK